MESNYESPGPDPSAHKQRMQAASQPSSSTLPFNPADPDAPLIALMTIQSNPELLARMDEPGFLEGILDRLKSYTQQPASLTSKLQKESDEKKPRGANSVAKAERARKLAEL